MFENSLLIIKPDYLHKRRPVLLEQSCDKMKKPLAGKCHKVIDKYGDQIANLLFKEMDPKLICTELGMCILADIDDREFLCLCNTLFHINKYYFQI